MKYWLFDGNDVIGPFAPQELAARADFSASSLICAEDASEDSAGWQMARFFDLFRFNDTTGRLEWVTLKDGSSVAGPVALPGYPAPAPQPQPAVEKETTPAVQPPSPQAKGIPAPASQQVAPAVQEVLPEETPEAEPVLPAAPETPKKKFVLSQVWGPIKPAVHAPGPVRLAADHIDLILPQGEKTATEKLPLADGFPVGEAAAAEANTPAPQPAPQQTQATPAPQAHPAPAQPAVIRPVKQPGPETEIISTCTLPIVNEILAQSDLPRLPEGNFQPVALPSEPDFDFKEFREDMSASSAPAQQEGEAAAASAQPEETTQAAPAVSVPSAREEQPDGQPQELVRAANVHSAPAIPAPPRPAQKPISQIEKKLAAYPGQEDLLLEQQLLAKPTRKKANLILWVFLLILAGTGCGMWLYPKLGHRPAQETAAVAPSTVQEELLPPQTPAPALAQRPAAQPPEVKAPPAPVTAADKALAIVQNHQLPGNKGTVASYFDRLYQTNLTQGYSASWSAEPLYKSTYIVKYRLTKPRTEPVVYVFQADVSRGKLTGALNNIALDLVGKI